MNMTSTSSVRSRFRREEAIDFRLIFMTSFVVFLVAAAISRLLPPQWRPFAQGGDRSIIEDARQAASTCTSFAFMA